MRERGFTSMAGTSHACSNYKPDRAQHANTYGIVRSITDEIDMQEEWAKRAESREMQESADWHRKWGKMMEEVLNQLLDQGLKPYFKTY